MLNPTSSERSPSKQEIHHGLKKGFLWSLGSILLIGVVGVFLFQQNWVPYELWTALRKADLGLLFLGWLFMCLAIFVLGYRWKVLLPNQEGISGGFLGFVLGGALLLNYALPGPFGELVAGWMLKRRYGTPIAVGLMTGGVARLLGLLTAAIGTLIFWLFVTLPSSETQLVLWGLVIGIALGTILLLCLFLLPQKMLTLLKNKNAKPIVFLKNILNSITSCTKNGLYSLLKASLWSIIGHGIAFLGIWLSLQAIISTDSVIGVLFTYLAGTCCGAIAFLIPGSQLAWDAIFAGLLASSTHYSMEEAAMLTGILRIEQLGMMMIGGLALLVILFQLSKAVPTEI